MKNRKPKDRSLILCILILLLFLLAGACEGEWMSEDRQTEKTIHEKTISADFT